MRRKQVGALAVVLVLVLAFVGPVRAEDATPEATPERRPPRLEYTTVAGCPDLATFRDELALMHADRFDPESRDAVRVTFAKVPGGSYRATVEYELSGGVWPAETVTDARCAAMARSVAFFASRGIPDPPLKGASKPQAPEPPTTPPAHAPEPARAEPLKALVFVPPPLPAQRFQVVAPTEKTFWQRLMDLSIGLNGLMFLTAAFSANVGGGASIGADVRGEIFSFGAEVRGVFPARAYAREVVVPGPGATQATLDVSQVSVLFMPCARWKYLVGCGVAQLGGLFWQSSDLVEGHGTSFIYAFGPRVGVDVPLGDKLSVIGFGEALFVPEPYGLGFRATDKNGKETGTVGWRQSWASVFFGAGISVKIK